MGGVGACALQKTSAFLLNIVIAKAAELDADPLYLLTNSRCAAAIRLYEKVGFQQDAGIMAEYGARYARCDVAMRYGPRSDVTAG